VTIPPGTYGALNGAQPFCLRQYFEDFVSAVPICTSHWQKGGRQQDEFLGRRSLLLNPPVKITASNSSKRRVARNQVGFIGKSVRGRLSVSCIPSSVKSAQINSRSY